nr:hypothetical protein [Tanacetum cinerariifolium]
MPLFPSPEPSVSCIDDLDFFKDFENEFSALVYNDALTSKSDFSNELTLCPQHIDEFSLKNETSSSECNKKEQNVLYFNDLFPFNMIYPDDLKSDRDNDDDKIDIKQPSGDMSVIPLPNGGALLHYDAEIELMNLILLSIPNDIYNFVDACTSAKDMWKRVKRLMRGIIQNKVDRETHFINEFDQFVVEPGEALVFVYNRFAQLMNDLERNDMHFPIQFEKLVNTSRTKKLEKFHDPLAQVAHMGSSSRNTASYYVTHPTSYYVTHPTSVVDYDDEY